MIQLGGVLGGVGRVGRVGNITTTYIQLTLWLDQFVILMPHSNVISFLFLMSPFISFI